MTPPPKPPPIEQTEQVDDLTIERAERQSPGVNYDVVNGRLIEVPIPPPRGLAS